MAHAKVRSLAVVVEDRAVVQAGFNEWAASSGRSLTEISLLLSV